MRFSQNFKNKILRPIGSSTSDDILIMIKFDVRFKMTKNTIFNVVAETTSKNVFFVILKHTSNFIMIKISTEVEEPIGGMFYF